MLSIADGDLLTVEYLDSDDGQGGTDLSRQDTAVADCAGPVTSLVRAIDVTDDADLVREMALSGCTGVFVGFESL